MMVQTGMAHRHCRGPKYHHLVYLDPSLHLVPLRQMGALQPNRTKVLSPSTAKSSKIAPPSAPIPSQVPIPMPLVQGAHEEKEEKEVTKAKASISINNEVQVDKTYLVLRGLPPEGWLLRGALRLQLFVRR
jgi:hypothetical protein